MPVPGDHYEMTDAVWAQGITTTRTSPTRCLVLTSAVLVQRLPFKTRSPYDSESYASSKGTALSASSLRPR
eukprot:3407832-Rhodomonas_salina.1